MKNHLEFQPLWFDSMGAKSTSTLVKTPDITIVIDPGVAIMQPSFPASPEQKEEWLAIAENRIKEACQKADIITISHYHYDHYFPDDFNVYRGKTVFVKNPNEYINNNQRERGEKFFNDIFKEFEIDEKDKLFTKQKKTEYRDPLYDIPHAASKDFKSYNERRKEVLSKGRKRFKKHAKNWLSYEQLPEIKSNNIKIIFPEEKSFKFGDTKLRFTKPLFHGIEYAGVGHWDKYTSIRYNMGEQLFAERRFEAALDTYLEVAYLQLNGARDTGLKVDPDLGPDAKLFDPELGFVRTTVVGRLGECAEFLGRSLADSRGRFIELAQKQQQRTSYQNTAQQDYLRARAACLEAKGYTVK